MSEPNQTSPTSSPPSSSATERPEVDVALTKDVDSISELFAKSPLEWSETERKRVVEKYRAMRKELDASPTKKPRTEKLPVEDLKGISGDDLLGKLGL